MSDMGIPGPNAPTGWARGPAKRDLISPHGGKLISLWTTEEEAREIAREARSFPAVHLDRRQLSDLELLASGGKRAGFSDSPEAFSAATISRRSRICLVSPPGPYGRSRSPWPSMARPPPSSPQGSRSLSTMMGASCSGSFTSATNSSTTRRNTPGASSRRRARATLGSRGSTSRGSGFWADP